MEYIRLVDLFSIQKCTLSFICPSKTTSLDTTGLTERHLRKPTVRVLTPSTYTHTWVKRNLPSPFIESYPGKGKSIVW